MKNKLYKIISFALCFIFAVALSACGQQNPPESETSSVNKNEVTVSFYSGETLLSSVTVQRGELVAEPEAPKRANCNFDGWYSNSTRTRKFDFSQPITQDTPVYANFKLNTTKLKYTIEAGALAGVFTVWTKEYNKSTGKYEGGQGSGVIYKKDGNTYYLLTNNHVVSLGVNPEATYEVEDYEGKKYTATLYKTSSGASARAVGYDLAVLTFTTATSYPVAKLAEADPVFDDGVIAVGTPQGKKNTITYGKVTGVLVAPKADSAQSSIKFPVIWHSAVCDHGSSGGPLFNSDLEVVGINYAGVGQEENGNMSVPVTKVKEFLKNYGVQ